MQPTHTLQTKVSTTSPSALYQLQLFGSFVIVCFHLSGRMVHRKPAASEPCASKGKPSNFKPFPSPKKGVQRKIHKRPAGKKTNAWVKTPYVQKKFASVQGRQDQKKWKRTVQQLLAADDVSIVRLLIEDGLLPPMEGKTCPICNKGTLGKLQLRESGLPRHRCSRKVCQRFVTPQHLHPLFTATMGPEGHSLQLQAVALLMLVSNVPLSTIHVLTQINHKALERMWRSLAFLRKSFVEKNEKAIQFGKGRAWQDIEADEATFDKLMSDSLVHWEQWAGLVARGRPESLVLVRCKPPPTTSRAPGPGAIRKVDRQPIANRWLKGRNIIFHTDSARSYKAKAPGVLHDSVVHQKKRVKVRGKFVWKSPNFVKLTTQLPCGKKLHVKAGTQIIDRTWRFIKDRLRLNQLSHEKNLNVLFM